MVLLYDLQRFDGKEFIPLTTNSVWQRVGRADRRGFDVYGEAVLLSPCWERDYFEEYQQGNFEPILSQLSDVRFLSEQIIVEIATGMAKTDLQIKQVFKNSLAEKQKVLLVLIKTRHYRSISLA